MVRVNKRLLRNVEIAAVIAVLSATILFLYEIFGHPGEQFHHFIDTMELLFCLIFFSEIGLKLTDSEDKRLYLKNNWFYILSITPFGRIFRLLGLGRIWQLGRIGEIARYFSFASEESRFLSVVTRRFALIKESSLILYHIRKCKPHRLPEKLDYRYVELYVSPHADDSVVKGICQGLKEHARKNMNLKLIFLSKPWIRLFPVEQKHMNNPNDHIRLDEMMQDFNCTNRWKIAITDEKLKYKYLAVHGRLEEDRSSFKGIFSTAYLNHPHVYEHIDFSYFKELRGYVSARHLMQESLERKASAKPDFTNILEPSKVDLRSYLCYLNNRYCTEQNLTA